MKFERGFAQHVGSRPEQQDAGLVLSDDGNSEQLIIVADGMGGHAGGSIASAQLAETAKRLWAEHRKSALEPKRLLERIIREGHDAINKAGAEKGLTPRSTCVMLLIRNGTAHWAHVGDSRIYRLRDGQVTRLTRDHSVVQMLVDLGKVAEEEMGRHPDQNRLTQSLGGEAAPMPDFGNDAVKTHDAFLVCSDGLWEMIPPAEMAATLAAKKLGDDGARHLAERAFDRAKPKSDNITVALLRVGGPPPGGAAMDLDEAPTTRLPEAARPRAGGGPRWAYAAATVVAVGAAGAAVFGPWANKGGVDFQPAGVHRDEPGRKSADPPNPPGRQGEDKKGEEKKGEEKKGDEKKDQDRTPPARDQQKDDRGKPEGERGGDKPGTDQKRDDNQKREEKKSDDKQPSPKPAGKPDDPQRPGQSESPDQGWWYQR